MKKYKFLLSVCIFFTVLNPVNAQIEDEIKSFVDSTELLINNGRKMLLQHLQTKDYQKVAEIYNFLNMKTSTRNCSAFTYYESLYITSLINDWAGFLTQAAHYSDAIRKPLCYPSTYRSQFARDQLSEFLYREVEANASQFWENIQNDELLTNEDKELLDIYFYLLENGQDEIFDKTLKNFKKNYPQSRYSDFVNNYLPQPQPKLAMSFGFGVAEIFPTGNLRNYFIPATAFTMSWDFHVNNVFLALQFNAGSMKLKKPLLAEETGYEQDFLKNERFSYADFGVLGGYVVAQNKRLQLSPFVYLGGTTLKSNIYESDENDLEFEIFNTFFVGPGLRTEVKLVGFDNFRPNSINIRFDVGYNIPVKYNYSPANGNIFYTRMALVWWIGDSLF